jgi:xanthine/uracil permease
VNLVTAAVAVIVGAGNYTLKLGSDEFAGIALGSLAAIVIYQVLRRLQPEILAPTEPEGGAYGDALAEPLARTPDPRGPTTP